jgi:erythronate-4-phosphate dehydrogenase
VVRILADPGIALVEEAFAALGHLDLVHGREWTPADVRDADILLASTRARIDARLLEGSRVRFVATASSGTEHIDTSYLDGRGIAFADARGANANAVAEYVLSAIARLLSERQGRFDGLRVGVVGCGAIGTRVAEMLKVLGVSCVLNDPPLAQGGDKRPFEALDRALACDVVTLHVPLTVGAAFPTRHLIDRSALARIPPGACLINAARGGVVDEQALLERLEAGPELAVALDCWEGEPEISIETCNRVWLATPHIAGYSLAARVAATVAIYRAACRFLGRSPVWSPSPPAPTADAAITELDFRLDDQTLIREAVLRCYDVATDSARSRAALAEAAADRAGAFEGLRRRYRLRREFHEFTVAVPPQRPALAARLRGLGLRVAGRLVAGGAPGSIGSAPRLN